MLETTVAGSLHKPLWLAEPEKLWPAWKLEGPALAAGKLDATVLAVKLQEDAGIDIVSDGEQAQTKGITGVPFFIFAGRLGMPGAQEASVLQRAMAEARQSMNEAPSEAPAV